MTPDHTALTKAEWQTARALVTGWKDDREAAHSCPRCEVEGLEVTDNSVRPYAEWYRLHCTACGLDVTMHLPLAPTPGGSV